MDTTEFNQCLIAAQKGLRPAAIKLTQDKDDANDLIQETLLKAIKNRHAFREGTNFQAWIYTIMRNTFISHYHRVVRARETIKSREVKGVIMYGISTTQDNEGVNRLAAEEISLRIERLPQLFRKPLMMYADGYKYQEIAEVLGLPVGTIKNRIHIARKMVKQYLMPIGIC